MRTLFNSGTETIALEGMPIDEVIALEEISDEEAQLIAQSAIKYAMEAESILMETERITDIAISLEEALMISGTVQVATEAELAFLETIGNLATAGTNVDPERIVPSMESYIGTTISLEGLKETIGNIWEKIKVFIKKVWEALKNFYNENMREIPRLKASLLAFQKKIAGKTSMEKDSKETITITSGVEYLQVDGKALETEKEINDAFETLSENAKWVFGPYMESVIKRGEIAEQVIGAGTITEELIVLAVKSFIDHPLATIPNSKLSESTPTQLHLRGAALLGNGRLQARVMAKHENFEGLEGLGIVRQDTCIFEVKSESTLKEIKLRPLSSGAMNLLIDDMVSTLGTLAKYQYGSVAKKLEATSWNLNKSTEHAATVIGKLEDITPSDPNTSFSLAESTASYRELVQLNTAYVKWAKDPAVSMMRHVISTIKALAMVMSKSLSSYSTTKGEKADTVQSHEFDIKLTRTHATEQRSGIDYFHEEDGNFEKYNALKGKVGLINGKLMKITKVETIVAPTSSKARNIITIVAETVE